MNSKATPANDQQATDVVPLIPVLFDQDTLILVEHNGQPYVVMKPLVTAMGLAWPPQYVKLMEKFGSVVTEIMTTGADGKQYSMTCLPLRKLPGWLYSINPGKLVPSLRVKVVRYQDECDEVLWRHWTQLEAPTANGGRLSSSDRDRYLRRRGDLRKELGQTTRLAVATDAYADYVMVSSYLGLRTSSLRELAPGLRQQQLETEVEGGAA